LFCYLVFTNNPRLSDLLLVSVKVTEVARYGVCWNMDLIVVAIVYLLASYNSRCKRERLSGVVDCNYSNSFS